MAGLHKTVNPPYEKSHREDYFALVRFKSAYNALHRKVYRSAPLFLPDRLFILFLLSQYMPNIISNKAASSI